MNALIAWIDANPIALWVQTSAWAFPAIEVVHVLAVTIVFGAIAVVDLRLLGLAGTRRAYAPLADDSLRVVWIGFLVAVLTGALLFSSQAGSYLGNRFFQAKMLLLVLAGLNMLVMEFVVSRTRETWGPGRGTIPRMGRLCGFLSLAFWMTVIVCGRWIGFTMFQVPI